MPKQADDIGREVMQEQSGWIDEARTCLTLTVYLHLSRSTEEAFRDGTRQLLEDVERSVRANLPTAALGYPPVVICFSQMPEDSDG